MTKYRPIHRTSNLTLTNYQLHVTVCSLKKKQTKQIYDGVTLLTPLRAIYAATTSSALTKYHPATRISIAVIERRDSHLSNVAGQTGEIGPDEAVRVDMRRPTVVAVEQRGGRFRYGGARIRTPCAPPSPPYVVTVPSAWSTLLNGTCIS